MQEAKRVPSFAGHFLKEWQKTQNLTQEQLARDLAIEPRTLRAYLNGERQLNNVQELRRIADRLGVAPERLGVASLSVPRTAEQIEDVLTHVWALVEASRISEAHVTIERLIQNVQAQITTENPLLVRSLARAYHAAGYVAAEATRARESYAAILHYRQMQSLANMLQDDTLLNIALTYQGDMYRRLGNVTEALTYLEAARDTTPQADPAARGNAIQLLARAYLQKKEVNGFERAMAQAEALTSSFDAASSSTQGHYSLGTVYEEYGRGYTRLGQIRKAIDYLDRAQAALPQTRFWQLLVKTARPMTLIKSGDIRAGVELAIEAAQECRAIGNLRYLERIYSVQQHLDNVKRDLEHLSMPLRDVLDEGQSTEL